LLLKYGLLKTAIITAIIIVKRIKLHYQYIFSIIIVMHLTETTNSQKDVPPNKKKL